MDMKAEVSAIIDEFKMTCILEESHLVDMKIMIEQFLSKYGVHNIAFTVTTRDDLENITVYIVDFVDLDLMAKITAHRIKKQRLFEESTVYQYMLEPYKSTDKRLLELINTYTDEDFMDEYYYKEPEEAIGELLRLNHLDEVKYELEEIHSHSFRGHVDAEYKLTFPEYGIMTTLIIETTQRNSRGERDDFYLYSFKQEEVKEHLEEKPAEYPLRFWDAAERCLNNEGFIRGSDFAKGIYVRCKDEELILIDGGNYHQPIGALGITNGLRLQKYKIFTVSNPKIIGLED